MKYLMLIYQGTTPLPGTDAWNALPEDEPGAPLRDRSEIFRNIRETPLPYYDTGKRRPRLPWHRFSSLSGL